MSQIPALTAERIARTIAGEIAANPRQVEAATALLDEGATVPFIARYRKEATGGLDDTQLRTLGDLTLRAWERGVQVMVEPVNPMDVPGFFLTGLEAATGVLDEADHPNLFLQFDFYHMALTEPDLCTAIARAAPWIGHVQFADAPGRNEPGSGGIDFTAALQALRDTGYAGAVSAEYRPAADTAAGLGWMKSFRKALA